MSLGRVVVRAQVYDVTVPLAVGRGGDATPLAVGRWECREADSSSWTGPCSALHLHPGTAASRILWILGCFRRCCDCRACRFFGGAKVNLLPRFIKWFIKYVFGCEASKSAFLLFVF